MRKGRKTTFVLSGVLVGLMSTVVIGNWQRTRPNVVMIVVDSLRADSVSGAIGAAKTPNLRALRESGIEFPNAFSHSPVTLPAHAALYSSRLPYDSGVVADGDPVDRSVTLLPEWLQAHGYRTMAAISLSDLWPGKEGTGLDRGFQEFDRGTEPVERAASVVRRATGFLDHVQPDDSFFLLAHFADPHEPYNDYAGEQQQARIVLDDQPLGWVTTSEMNRWEHSAVLTPGEHLLEFSSDAGVRLRNFTYDYGGRAMPFEVRVGEFLGASERIVIELNNPSDGSIEVSLRAWLNDAPPLMEIRERYEREIEAVDQAIGDLVTELKWRGLYEDTIIVLTAGYGEALGDHGHVGHDENLYDELLHVPLYIRVPKHWTEKRARLLENSPGLARHLDVAPTLLDLAGLPQWEGMQGLSLMQEVMRVVQAETFPPAAPRTLFAMRDSQYKLIYDPAGTGSFSMFRLGPDPTELDDVFGHQGHLRNKWQAVMRARAAMALGQR